MVKEMTHHIKREWEEKIKETKEKKIFEALENPKWDFRTIDGLSRSTELSHEDITIVLGKYQDFIQIVRIPDRKGRKLYKLKGKSTKKLEVLNALRVFISKSVS